MKKIIYTIVVLFILNSSFLILNCFSQWQSDVRLTNNPAGSYTSFNNAWCVASSGSVVHVVWHDTRDGANEEIYYKRSSDAGVSWGADVRLTNNTAISNLPSVAVSGSVVHVVWQDYRDGNSEIYYKRSSDAGINWGSDIRLTNNIGISNYPSVAISGSAVHVVWQDNRSGNLYIYYKRSTDAGINWGADIQMTSNTPYSDNPSVAVSGSIVHVVWYDYRDWNEEIYYKRSTDGGLTWGTIVRLTNTTTDSRFTSVAVSGSVVHVVWMDEVVSTSKGEIYYKRSTDAGISWGAPIPLTNSTADSEYPSVTVSGSNVHIVWQYCPDANNSDIYYKRSTDGGVSWGADTRLTYADLNSSRPSIALSGTALHVVWGDERDVVNQWEIYYKRNPTGNSIGIENISTEIPSKYSLGQNYPNPFNPTTKIKFNVVRLGDVKIVVYDVMGREVQTLVNESLKPGTYEASFDGSQLTSGVYFYKLMTDGFTETKKMMMLK